MTISIIQSAWEKFNSIPKENFTDVVVQAISMMQLINDFKKEDKERLYWLRNNTHDDILRSIYELDRYVDPTKGNIVNKKFGFNGEYYHQDQLQTFLCIAIEEVCEIIYRNFKDYKVEVKSNVDDDTQQGDDSW